MATQEEMLRRVRAALGKPLEERSSSPQGLPPVDLREVMPPIAPEDLLAKFEAELEKVSGSAHRASSRADLEATLAKILSDAQASTIVLSRNSILGRLGVAEKLRARGLTVTAWPTESSRDPEGRANAGKDFASACFAATVGITGLDFALAESGSLILSSVTEGSQLASLAPPIHVALYRRRQLVASLDAVLESLAPSVAAMSSSPPLPTGAGSPSPPAPHASLPSQPLTGRSLVFITGTSRTADIEQVLIRGVHGPRAVHAVLVEEACFALPGS